MGLHPLRSTGGNCHGSASPALIGSSHRACQQFGNPIPRHRTDAVVLTARKLDGRVPNSVFGEDLSSEFLFDDCLHVVASAKSGWSRRRRINLAELAHEPWLMPESDNIAMALISEAFLAVGLTPPAPQIISNSITFRMRLIETGQFIAILPDSSLRFGASRPQIKILPIRLRLKAPPAVGRLKVAALSANVSAALPVLTVKFLRPVAANPLPPIVIESLAVVADASRVIAGMLKTLTGAMALPLVPEI